MAVFLLYSYHQADKFYPFRRRATDADEVFGLIVQTNAIHSGNKSFTALNQQFFCIKRQEVALLLKHYKVVNKPTNSDRTSAFKTKRPSPKIPYISARPLTAGKQALELLKWKVGRSANANIGHLRRGAEKSGEAAVYGGRWSALRWQTRGGKEEGGGEGGFLRLVGVHPGHFFVGSARTARGWN